MTNKHYPNTLKELPIWALWRLEAGAKGRPTKVPYSPIYEGRASSVNPDSWGTFEQALHKLNSRPDYYNGISLIISKQYGLIFIDIDHCVDRDGVLNETATDIVGAFDAQFMEFSQSGTGIHIITKGQIPKSFKNSKNGVEMYNDKRFCALTGDVLIKGEPSQEQSVIDVLYQKYKTPEKAKKRVISKNRALRNDDKWIIDHASKRGKFSDLYQGDWTGLYGSQSEADLALCLILAFWTDCNTDQIDRIFRSSGLFREKWERQDYRDATIESAILQCEDTLSEYIRRKEIEGGDRFDKALSQRWDR